MSHLEIILSIVCIALAAAVIGLCIYTLLSKKKIKGLTNSINEYLEKGEFTKFSTSEGAFAELQNTVCDLQNELRNQKNNTAIQTKRNSDFIADVSHQFKTPIAGLRLYVEMDNAVNPSDHTEKELQLVEKMEQLIAKLLHLEKLRSDAYTMDFAAYNTDALIGSIIGEFKTIYSEKIFTVHGNAELRCDKEWLSQAIGNVIKNACEHTSENGKINVSVDNNEKSVIITVADNGGGVDETEIPLLFNRFHRTKNAKPQSTGIGLAITKAIVEKHHGTVAAENTAEGLSVIMCFPKIDGIIAV